MPVWRGSSLTPADQEQVKLEYLYRMTAETILADTRTTRMMLEGGWRCPVITDQQWLTESHFVVTKRGRLDRRVQHYDSHGRTTHPVPAKPWTLETITAEARRVLGK